MRILLLGNGLNLALVDDPKKYDILSDEVGDFLGVIGYKRGYKVTKETFDFAEFKKWLGPSSKNEESKKVFDLYESVNADLAYDIELLAQLFFSTGKFERLGKGVKDGIQSWINKMRIRVVKKISVTNDEFDKKIVKRLNSDYQLIITTNYDENLEKSKVENVYHAHGTYKDPDSIELITFKKYQSILKTIKDEINGKANEKIEIDIFGLSLFNEIHILNVLFHLKMEYKEMLVINQYIYANTDRSFDEQNISNIFLTYFYKLKWGDGPTQFKDSIPDIDNDWMIEPIDQLENPLKAETFLRDAVIKQYIYKTNESPTNDDIEIFKFIFKFCKSIQVHTSSEHFLSDIDSSFTPSTIEIDMAKILNK